MGILISFIVGGVVGYLISAVGYKTLLADLEAEITRLKSKL